MQSFWERLKSRVVEFKFSGQTQATSSAQNQLQQQRILAKLDSERHYLTSGLDAPVFTLPPNNRSIDDEDMVVDELHVTTLSRREPNNGILMWVHQAYLLHCGTVGN